MGECHERMISSRAAWMALYGKPQRALTPYSVSCIQLSQGEIRIPQTSERNNLQRQANGVAKQPAAK
jgi:hypothetical protein